MYLQQGSVLFVIVDNTCVVKIEALYMTVMYMYHSIYMHVLCFSDLLLSKTDSEQSQLKEQ